MFSSQIKTPTHTSDHSASGLRRSFFGSQGNIYNPTSPKINLPSPKNMNSQRIARTNILEAILGHPEKKLVGSPVAAAASKKYFKRIGSQDELQLKSGKYDNSGSFRGLSPVAPISIHQFPIKKDKIGRKLIGNDKGERQDSDLNFSVPIKEEDKSIQVQLGMSRIENVKETKEDVEKELQKKELIIKIYQEILALTASKKSPKRRNMKTLQETSADICESATEEEMKKALGDKPRLGDNRSVGNLKGRKEKVRGLSVAGAGATNSSYSMQQQKSTQRTLNKTSYDSKMNIRGLDVNNNVNSTEESGCLTPIFLSKPSLKKLGDARPKSGVNQYRIRKGATGLEDERSSGFSGSLSPARKDMRYDPTILIKEGNYKNGRRSQDVTKSVIQIKKDAFVDLGNRLDSVFTAYNKKNEQMIKEIEDMARKIAILQNAKKKAAPKN